MSLLRASVIELSVLALNVALSELTDRNIRLVMRVERESNINVLFPGINFMTIDI